MSLPVIPSISILPPPRNEKRLKLWMDELLKTFNHKDYLSTDPIQFVPRYKMKSDREVAALICALFSYGNVSSIRKSLSQILAPLENEPAENLKTMSDRAIENHWKDSYYRFYSARDIQHLFKRLRRILKERESLESFFDLKGADDSKILKGLEQMRARFLDRSIVTPGLKFMFSDPLRSPSKRWHMLLRWLVRKDEIDLGIWKSLAPANLILPLDTHVFDMVRHLNLTNSKTPSLHAALQVTEKLCTWDAQDPVKYDFALCRLGVLGFKKSILAGKDLKTA